MAVKEWLRELLKQRSLAPLNIISIDGRESFAIPAVHLQQLLDELEC